MFRHRGCAVALVALGLLTGCDQVHVTNAGGDVGLFVDAQGTPNPVNDLRYSDNGAGDLHFNVGDFTSAVPPNRNEAIGFGDDRAPRRIPTPWTSGDDLFNLTLGSNIPISITVWIVQGPFTTQRDRSIDHLLTTAAIWADERSGLRLGVIDFVDATSDPDIDNAILNSVGGDNRNWDDFSNDIGLTAGRINVYYINTVEGSTTTGWSDFGGRIVMGRLTLDDLLVHEIGHALELFHTSGADFDVTNVMRSASSSRAFFTEGQVFRAHFLAGSAVNDIFAARSGEPQITCPAINGTEECPATRRRIWADGTFPPN